MKFALDFQKKLTKKKIGPNGEITYIEREEGGRSSIRLRDAASSREAGGCQPRDIARQQRVVHVKQQRQQRQYLLLAR